MPDFDRLETFNYHLPPELIARQPADRRDDSRLLVVDRQRGTFRHRKFRDLPELLSAGDCLVLNNSRVIPAKLQGIRTATGGRWEGLFLAEESLGTWRVIGQTRGTLQPGESITLRSPDADRTLELELIEKREAGEWLMRPRADASTLELLESVGDVPLPHYMHRDAADVVDRERYQTTYAVHPGSVAAPTAGLHFTPEVLSRVAQLGVTRAELTLHVGLGTFRPVSSEVVSEHRMHAEWGQVSEETASTVRQCRERGGRILAVGTTSVRTLETAAIQAGFGEPWVGTTDIFIRPGFAFQAVDVLLTNFHLPKSTLIMLVAAFAGYDLTMEAYRIAVAEHYRFFSYGDAMLIL